MLRVLCAALLAAAAPGAALAKAKPPPPKPLPPVRYVCEDGTRLAVTFSAPSIVPGTATVRVLGTDKELTLTRGASADGGRYVGGTTEFWDKGATAAFSQGGTTLPCRAKR